MINQAIVKMELGGRTLTLETGRLASQATSAVVGRYGDTMVLTTLVMSEKEADLNYLPLFVEYQEKLYAGGRIKGSRWVKREGRPSDETILSARLIDRSLRPLFPKDFRKEIQIISTILSVDGQSDPDILAIITASAALSISPIPWAGPVAAVRIGHIKTKSETVTQSIIVNPEASEKEYSSMDLVVSATAEKVVMLEGSLNEASEDKVLEAIDLAQTNIRQIIQLINDFSAKQKVSKLKLLKSEIKPELREIVKKAESQIDKIVKETDHQQSQQLLNHLHQHLKEENPLVSAVKLQSAIDKVLQKKVREGILLKNKRPDGRKPEEIRPISVNVGILPRTHGSAIFQRGETQALTVTTLGSPSLEQWLESAFGEGTKRYMHHYYMPPYSVGETGRLGWPSRREVGHGALAEKALLPLIPSEEKFPYAIRVVSEITSSNGSTSMAAVCGSSLSLMDGGVPLKKPVAGIALGLVVDEKSENKFVLLSDIAGVEDFYGDMDFKVAGSKDGITAIQLDVKINGLSQPIIKETLKRAKKGRLLILEKMLAVLPGPRQQLSQYAPQVKMLQVAVPKIGSIIGSGGKTIRRIMAETGTTIDVDDEGKVTIAGKDKDLLEKAASWVESLVKEVEIGEIYEGEVKKILPFGAFVEILPNRDGFVHVSEMSTDYVRTPEDFIKVGQKVKVKVRDVENGKISLTMILDGRRPKPHRSQPRPFRPFRRDTHPRRQPPPSGYKTFFADEKRRRDR